MLNVAWLETITKNIKYENGSKKESRKVFPYKIIITIIICVKKTEGKGKSRNMAISEETPEKEREEDKGEGERLQQTNRDIIYCFFYQPLFTL